jgi:hypothetical protein
MGRVPASPYDREASDVMSRRDVLVDPTETHLLYHVRPDDAGAPGGG